MTDNYWLWRCRVRSSHLLNNDVLLLLVPKRLLSMMHFSCMLLIHKHYEHKMLRMSCLRCVGLLRTRDCCDVVTGFQPRHLGIQLELTTRVYRTQTFSLDRTVGNCRGNRMTGGMIRNVVTGLPRHLGTQLELATRVYRTQTLLVDRTVGTRRGNRKIGGMLREERESSSYILHRWDHRTERIRMAGNRATAEGGLCRAEQLCSEERWTGGGSNLVTDGVTMARAVGRNN